MREPIITLAGLLGTSHMWLDFEEKARALFNYANIEYLHTVELHHRRGQFANWNSTETEDFANALFRLVEQYAAFSIEFSVLKSRFEKGKISCGVEHQTSPMAFCFHGVINHIVKDEGYLNAAKEFDFDLSFIVESGHANNQDIRRRFNAVRKKDPKRFKFLKFEDKMSTIALQSADFIAFYSRRIRNATADNPRKEELKFFQRVLGNMKHTPFLATNFGV